jgi:hypothetical protein
VGHLRASEWQVLAIPDHEEAVAACRRWHYARGASKASTYRHGLYRIDPDVGEVFRGDLLGAALWIPPTQGAAATVNEVDPNGVLCLSRLVVAPEVPTNGASFLLGRSMAAIDRERWPVLLTYADTALGHTGAIYRATNWVELGPVPAGDTWSNDAGVQRGRKRGGRTLLAAEMVAAGFTRRPASPKIKFVHSV